MGAFGYRTTTHQGAGEYFGQMGVNIRCQGMIDTSRASIYP